MSGATREQLDCLDEAARWNANFTGVMILASEDARRDVWRAWKLMSGGRHNDKTKTTTYPRSESQVSFVVTPP